MTTMWIQLGLAFFGFILVAYLMLQLKQKTQALESLTESQRYGKNDNHNKNISVNHGANQEFQKQSSVIKKLETELWQVKNELKDCKIELKETKRKNWASKQVQLTEEKKPSVLDSNVVAKTDPRSDEHTQTIAQLESKIISLKTDLSTMGEQNTQYQQQLKNTQAELDAFNKTAQDKQVQSQSRIRQLTEQLEIEKKRIGAEASSLIKMKRKVEDFRRIFLVQKNEFGIQKDKLAHIRRRYLQLCSEYVKLLKIKTHLVVGAQPAPTCVDFKLDAQEIERLEQEERVYQAQSAIEMDEQQEDKTDTSNLHEKSIPAA